MRWAQGWGGEGLRWALQQQQQQQRQLCLLWWRLHLRLCLRLSVWHLWQLLQTGTLLPAERPGLPERLQRELLGCLGIGSGSGELQKGAGEDWAWLTGSAS